MFCKDCGNWDWRGTGIGCLIGMCPFCLLEDSSADSSVTSYSYSLATPSYTYCSVSSCLTKVYGTSYCANHVKYCNESSCYQRIASSQAYCAPCLEKQEQNQLKSLVKQRTSITGTIAEVTRFEAAS